MSPLANRFVIVTRGRFHARGRAIKSKLSQWSAGLLGRQERGLGNVQTVSNAAHVHDEPRLRRVIFELVA
jgi:hypothetical protein